MPEPLVSIIMPAYNAEASLGNALNSVLAQDYSALEIIVVDDGSSDGTQQLCESYGDRIRYIRQENAGASVARNRGIDEARGELIGFLDSDDLYLPGKIRKLVELWNAYPDVGAYTAAFREQMPTGLFTNPKPGTVFPDGSKAGVIDYFQCEYRGCWVVHTNTILVKRDVLHDVGGFDPALRFGEDVDLWSRIAGKYDMAYLDEPVAVYDRTNELSLCAQAHILDHGLEYLRAGREEKAVIQKERRKSYRRFRNKILLARLMLSIYEKDRAYLLKCLRKLRPVPFNIRVVVGAVLCCIPTRFWPAK